MAYYAHLEANLHCPTCGVRVETAYGLLWFQWGYCPSYQPVDEFIYRIGDSVRWRTCADGTTPAWTYFRDDPAQITSATWGGANIGDPAVLDLLAQDETQFYRPPGEERRRCTACGAVLEGAIVEIKQGVITRAWVYQPGEFDPAISRYLLAVDGTPSPMNQWTSQRMHARVGC